MNIDFNRIETIVHGRVKKSMQFQIAQRGEAVLSPYCFGILPRETPHAMEMMRAIIPEGYHIGLNERGDFRIYK